MSWGVHPSPFGRCLLGVTERGIYSLHFVQESSEAEDWLASSRPRAWLRKDPALTAGYVQRVFPFRPETPPPRCTCTCAAPTSRSWSGKPCCVSPWALR